MDSGTLNPREAARSRVKNAQALKHKDLLYIGYSIEKRLTGVVKSGAAARPTRSLPTHAKPKSSNTGKSVPLPRAPAPGEAKSNQEQPGSARTS